MGVEFKALLIPRDNTFRPSIAHIADVIGAWSSRGYVSLTQDCNFESPEGVRQIAQPTGVEALAMMQAAEFILSWEAESRPPRYPMAWVPSFDSSAEPYWTLKLHLSEDFIEETSEQNDPLDATCVCGEDLYYSLDNDIFYSGRIRRVCPACGARFVPQDQSAFTRHPLTREVSELPGGTAHRFAIKVDCGKCWKTRRGANGTEEIPRLSDEFIALCGGVLQVPFDEVSYFD